MRERLIEMIQNSVGGCARYWAEVIADHLLANGVICPPGKVGEWVWCIELGQVKKAKIEELHYQASIHGHYSDDILFHAYDFKRKEEISFWRDDIGEAVFLTREEAEKALEEAEG